jgi:MFS transporter, CP family, cyanate transporter
LGRYGKTKEGPATATPGHPPPSRVRGVLLMLGILLLAAHLRPALTGLTPLIGQIRADTGISYGVAGLLTALPLLAMGVLSPIAPLLAVGLA